MTAAALWIKDSVDVMTNERISDTTGNEGMFAHLASNCLTGCVLATCTGS